jgi:hypothetical protein
MGISKKRAERRNKETRKLGEKWKKNIQSCPPLFSFGCLRHL